MMIFIFTLIFATSGPHRGIKKINALENFYILVLHYCCYYYDYPGVPIFEGAAIIMVTCMDTLDFTND